MPKIALLHPAVAGRIAAGEIIERPAAAVRELIENALDAGARSIEVRVDGGGFSLLRVDDDGCGMDAEDARLSVERHATSKLRAVEDLGRIATLGYRGEALAALVACADVELTTSTGEAGTYLRAEGGRVVTCRPAGRSRGTTVAAYRLFGLMPARRAALGAPGREAALCQRVVVGYALAHPEVRFRYVQDGRPVFHTLGDGDLAHVVAALYPVDLAERLVAVDGALALPEGDARVAGLVAPPAQARRNREHLQIAVNGRPVSHPALFAAVAGAFGPALPAGRYPFAILALQLPPGEVDPNVHPGKLALRLANEGVVCGLVRGAVARALEVTGPELDGPPRAIERAFAPADAADIERAAWFGQWAGTYLVFADDTSLYLVDQHAAAERVLYEQIVRADACHRPASPPELVLGPARARLVEDFAADLERLGFELTPSGPGRFRLRAVPAAWATLDLPEAFAEFLTDLVSAPEADPAAAAAAAACHNALRRGDQIDETQARSLVAALRRAGSPRTCLHGRPAYLRLPLSAADRLFLRGAG